MEFNQNIMIFIRVYKCEPVEINSEQKLN